MMDIRMMRKLSAAGMLLLLSMMLQVAICWGQENGPHSPLSIRADFAGGNILMEKIIGDTVWLKPDTKKINGDWFYWYFSAKSATDRTLYFRFPANKIPAFGPAISMDAGHSWTWMYDEEKKGLTAFKFKLPADEAVRFSMGFPYTYREYEDFISSYLSHPNVRIDTLCTTALGRKVPLLHINSLSSGPKLKVLLTARHHACEMMASYVLEGLIASILTDDKLARLRDQVEFLIVPFMDFDGVEDGDQGKNRAPRDHNRDYSGESIYASTRAIRLLVPKWADERFKVALDLHCPGLNGEGHEWTHLVGSKFERIAKNEKIFAELVSQSNNKGLNFKPDNVLKYGQSWNVDSNETMGRSFRSWIEHSFPQVTLSTSLETPYSNNLGQQVTDENSRLFGKRLAAALLKYLELEK